VSLFHFVLGLVVLQRLAELILAQRNTRRLLAKGAVEVGRGHYPLIVALHAAWIAVLALTVPADAPASWPLLGLFLVLQAARIWVIASLGPYWTTRIITLTAAPLVRRGPYRWLRHPNYLVVALEIAVLPLAFGAVWIALVFSLLNAVLLWHRIRVEAEALAGRR
jgi:methyltransferase